jgi:CRP/FNR family cyclic AMP-dependent transcriptional regulator
MPSASTIRLFELEPDLIRFLSRDERAEAIAVELPMRVLPKGAVDIHKLFARTGTFGAMLVDGMLLQSVRLGEHAGLRLLGPGDLLSLNETPRSALVLDTSCRATAPTRLVLFGREVLIAAHRWPRLVAGLHARAGEQAERMLMQLMICQLPRVDDRLLSLMWLLAESWGHVTASGTTLAMSLTHEALGGLIGARRPTVTLAIGELTESGAIVRQDGGWLLLRRPAHAAPDHGLRAEHPRPLDLSSSAWAAPAAAVHVGPNREMLQETVTRLHAETRRNADQLRDRLKRVRATRAQVAERRERTAGVRGARRPAPLSRSRP